MLDLFLFLFVWVNHEIVQLRVIVSNGVPKQVIIDHGLTPNRPILLLYLEHLLGHLPHGVVVWELGLEFYHGCLVFNCVFPVLILVATVLLVVPVAQVLFYVHLAGDVGVRRRVIVASVEGCLRDRGLPDDLHVAASVSIACHILLA